MATSSASTASVTVGPFSPRATTTTCTCSPTTAIASRCIRVDAMGGSLLAATNRRTTT